jgi:hypothetical protein
MENAAARVASMASSEAALKRRVEELESALARAAMDRQRVEQDASAQAQVFARLFDSTQAAAASQPPGANDD